MRAVFRAQLDQCVDQLATMCDLAVTAMRDATSALHNADLGLAERVVADDVRLDRARAVCEERAYSLLALQSPVARDLRVILAAVQSADTLERMGDLAKHVAEAVRRRHPRPVLPAPIRPTVATMAHAAIDLAETAGAVIRHPDLALCGSVTRGDDAVNAQHSHLLALLTSEDWPYGVQPAVDVAQLSRWYERYADHAVSLARRTMFVTTGRRDDAA